MVQTKLGAGGMGVVYRVHDRTRDRVLALKTFTGTSPRDLYRFKREFRALCDLAHPNLCALDELHTAGDEWFFTMELVRGVSFIDWVRPSHGSDGLAEGGPASRGRDQIAAAAVDLARLEDALAQLVDGVLALHVAGKLHRDLKPSNVLCEPGGRVVLLDFGLVAEVEPVRPEHTHAQAAVGTPAYMSPEQAADLPLTPASDLYAVGVMLFEALTGRRPFEGAALEVLRRKQRETPPLPGTLAAGVPPHLDRLCRALLAPEPRHRPDALAVLAAIGRAPSPATATVERTSAGGPFVGRRPLLAALADARSDARSRGVAVLVRGRSGMGKSTLIGRFLAELGPAVLRLTGRCYERDHAPYKTLDTLIDALTDSLLELTHAERESVLASDVTTLARVFPVLRRVPEIADRPRALTAGPLDPQELRARAWTALRGLLTRLARLREVVIGVDDLQWGDLDSTGLLADLITRRDRPPILLVIAYREEDAGGAIVRELERRIAGAAEPGDVRNLRVEPLLPDEARELVDRLTPSGDAAALVRESAGNTMFLAELARATAGAGAPASLDQLLAARIEPLPADARAVLVACAVAARAVPVEVVAHAAAVADPTAALTLLRAERLLRSDSGGTEHRRGGIEPFHDRVRAAVLEHLEPDALRAVHRALAVAYRHVTPGDPALAERLIDHLLGGGLTAEAADAAARAAVTAEQALAFQRAADLYGFALAHGGPDGVAGRTRASMLVARAAALVNAGRLVEAAAAYADAIPAVPPEQRLDLERLRVEQTLRAGHLADGLVLARAVLAQLGYRLPTTPRGGLAGLLRQRLMLRLRGLRARIRPAADIPAEDLRRSDVLWSVAAGLSFANPVLGRLVQAWQLRLSLALGEPRRLSASLGLEMGYLSGSGGRGDWPRIEKVAARGRELARSVDDPFQLAVMDAGLGFSRFMMGDWAQACELLGRCIGPLRDHVAGDRWQVDLAEIFYLASLYHAGRIAELIEHTHGFLADAFERGDVYAQHGIRSWRGNLTWLCLDRPDEARRHVDEVTAERGDLGDFGISEWYLVIARAQIDLYRGDAAAARRHLTDSLGPIAAHHLDRITSVRLETHWMDARTALATAVADRSTTAAALATVRAAARHLDREEPAWAHALATLIRAGASALAGDRTAAIAGYAAAHDRFAACGMALHAGVGLLAHNELTGVDFREARDALRALGVVDPAAMSQVIAPRSAPGSSFSAAEN